MFWAHQTDATAVTTNCAMAASSTTQVVADKWQFITVVADNATNTVSFYIDGKPAGVSKNVKKELKLINDGGGSGGLYLGRSGACQCLQYKGYMDEVSLWNAVISAFDINIHWQNAPVSWHHDFAKLIAYWKFDEGRVACRFA
jgi:hypothetical protein